MSNLVSRFKEAAPQPEFRRHFRAALAGKMLGLFLMFAVMGTISLCFFAHANAQASGQGASIDPANLKLTESTPFISAINTTWVLVAAFLVFFMQAGFMALEAGFARSKESVNIILEGIVDTCLCGLLFWAFGFAFMFCAGTPFIGLGHDPNILSSDAATAKAAAQYSYWFLSNPAATYGTTGIPILAFFLFQFAFADTCSTITSGAMLGRTGFVGDLLYSFGVSGFIYPIIGHWAWGPDGWLYSMGFLDFAGSTVVHTIGGMVALTGAIALGPRLGRVFKRDGGGLPFAHDMLIASIGGVILWFGWYGFNPGSTLSAMDVQGIARVATNTTLAATAGGLCALAYLFPRGKTWDCGITVNGFLAGLVGITCPCYWVSPFGAICIGAIAGVIVVMGVDFVEWLRIDDPVGAVAVHGACGIWGTISLGLFACGQYYLSGATGPTLPDKDHPAITGLFYGGGVGQLLKQVEGSAAVTIATFAVGMALMYAVKATGTLRISREGELEGVDLHEHGINAYPEFTLHASGSDMPSNGYGMSSTPVAAVREETAA
ncbi:ammonium transporter [Abditibacteriota bacterium]|nr:ammonium transporter [Abditibacteriota bacterium]